MQRNTVPFKANNIIETMVAKRQRDNGCKSKSGWVPSDCYPTCVLKEGAVQISVQKKNECERKPRLNKSQQCKINKGCKETKR